MLIKRKMRNKERNAFVGHAIGLLFGELIVFVGAMLVSWLILQDHITIDKTGFVGWFIIFAATFLGALYTTCYNKEKQLMNCAIYAIAFVVLNLVILMLFFDGISSNWWSGMMAALCGSVACCLVKMIPVKNKQYRKMRHG